jgi:hypothetical protein
MRISYRNQDRGRAGYPKLLTFPEEDALADLANHLETICN